MIRRWNHGPGGPPVRWLRIWAATVAAMALLGVLAGLLWAQISPEVRYVVVDGRALLIDPETQDLIGTDGRFALIAVLAGTLCGVAAYAAAGRGRDLPLVLGLAAGGVAAALLMWWAGHLVGLDAFRRLTRTGSTGRQITGVADLRAVGVVVFWPLVAVSVYGLLEALDIARRAAPLAPGDPGGAGTGQSDQISGGELDLQAAPSGRDVDGREAGG